MRLVLMSFALVLFAACNRGVTQPSVRDATAVPGDGNKDSYSVEGWVSDTAGRRLEGASVEVLTGERAGAVTTTDADGYYTFGNGFLSAPEMRADKSGYNVFEARVFWLPGTTTFRGVFRMGSPNPPIDLAGIYDLTFTADPACDGLPAEARSRTYRTAVVGNAPSHSLTLSGASFLPIAESYLANLIYLSTFENFVRVYFTDPPIWEELASPTSLFIYGEAEGEVTAPVATLTFSGEFEFCGVTSGAKCEEEVACHSKTHTLTLTRH